MPESEPPEIQNDEPRTMRKLLQKTAVVAGIAAGDLAQLAQAWESAAVVDTDPISLQLADACALLVTLFEGVEQTDERTCLRQGASAVHIAGVAAALAGACFERLADLTGEPGTLTGQAAAETDRG